MTQQAIITTAQDWRKALPAWLAEVQARTGSQRTPKEYLGHLEAFAATVPDVMHVTPVQVHVWAYAPGVRGKQPSPSTITVRLAALRSFYGFLGRTIGAADPTAAVARPKQRPPLPKGLTAPQLQTLLAAVPTSATGLRDKAIIMTIVFTGLRQAEALSLTADAFETDGCKAFYTVKVKGGTTRRREMPAPVMAAIKAHLEATAPGADGRLFNVTQQGFYDNLRRYATRADLGHVTPHTLRHSSAKLRRDTGATLEDVQQHLGHRSIATTARYLQRLEAETDNGWQPVAHMLGVQ